MSLTRFLLAATAAAILGVAGLLLLCPCHRSGAPDRPQATATVGGEAASRTLPAPLPSVAGIQAIPAAATGDTPAGPPRPMLTIDQAPEGPPPPGVEVTYAPSDNPPPLAPAGSITEIGRPFKTAEEKRAFEERERVAWEERKARELELIVELLTRELSLSAMQTQGLRRILEDESRRRVEVVTDLTEGRISQAEFRDRVDASLKQGRSELAALLSPEQFAKYQTLEPRRQVLNDKTITGH